MRRSFHLREYGEPKTAGARRTIELFPATTSLLQSLRPLHVEPTRPVFNNITGGTLDQQAFTRHWYTCLRSLGIRQRGLYCTKDTFVTTSLSLNCNIRWLEQQTGENYMTLKRHYGKWMPQEVGSEMRRFETADPALFAKLPLAKRVAEGQFAVTNRNGEEK